MAKTKQFTISVQNQPGAVAEIARTLGNAKVNILALLGTAQGTTGTVQLVVEDARLPKRSPDKPHGDDREKSERGRCPWTAEKGVNSRRLPRPGSSGPAQHQKAGNERDGEARVEKHVEVPVTRASGRAPCTGRRRVLASVCARAAAALRTRAETERESQS